MPGASPALPKPRQGIAFSLSGSATLPAIPTPARTGGLPSTRPSALGTPGQKWRRKGSGVILVHRLHLAGYCTDSRDSYGKAGFIRFAYYSNNFLGIL